MGFNCTELLFGVAVGICIELGFLTYFSGFDRTYIYTYEEIKIHHCHTSIPFQMITLKSHHSIDGCAK